VKLDNAKLLHTFRSTTPSSLTRRSFSRSLTKTGGLLKVKEASRHSWVSFWWNWLRNWSWACPERISSLILKEARSTLRGQTGSLSPSRIPSWKRSTTECKWETKRSLHTSLMCSSNSLKLPQRRTWIPSSHREVNHLITLRRIRWIKQASPTPPQAPVTSLVMKSKRILMMLQDQVSMKRHKSFQWMPTMILSFVKKMKKLNEPKLKC